METIRPSELRTAARVADALVYAAGFGGVVAGGLLFGDGEVPFAIVAWVLTFVAGAVLRLVGWACRALADLLVRSERIERGLDDLRDDRVPAPQPDRGERSADPYRRWGGFH
jgi:hypothetical protein